MNGTIAAFSMHLCRVLLTL